MKKIVLLLTVCLMASAMWGETIYVVTSTCNIPLKAGMSNATHQIFTWDGTSQTATTAISTDQKSTCGFYYNSTSLAYSDLMNTSNYSTSSGSNRTLRGIKLGTGTKMTITLGSVVISKVSVVGRCASNDNCTINIAGEDVSTQSNSVFFTKEVSGTFTQKVEINNTSAKEYNLFVYLTEGVACSGPTFTTQPATATATYKVGGTALPLTVAASGTGVSFQWYSNSTASTTGGTAISNATSSSYTPSTAAVGTTYYYCEAKASDCAVPTLSNVSGAITVQAKSADNTLSNLTVNGAQIAGFAPSTTSYNIMLPAGSGQPTVVPTKNDADATITAVSYSHPSANTYVATFSVTSESGATANYTINFTVDDGTPKITSFVVSGVTATIDQSSHTITATLPHGTSLTSLTPNVQVENASSYTPTGAQNFSSPVTYSVGGVNYTVTITVSQLSNNADLSYLGVNGGTLIPEFDPAITSYKVQVASGTTTVPQANAIKADPNAQNPDITNASSLSGTTTVVVTAQDGTTKTYSIIFEIVLPPSDLTTHQPGTYEDVAMAGGYGVPLVISGGREYEVYYINRDENSNLAIATSYVDKAGSISDASQSGSNNTITKDGWAKISGCNGTGGGQGSAPDEFGGTIRYAKFNSASHELKMRVKGFDQFSYYGNDNNGDASKNKMFEIYIDGVKQAHTPSSSLAVYRFDLTTMVEHEVKITAIGGSDSKLYAFSLRVGTDPRVKHLKGNDSTQIIYQTSNLSPIYYFTKYNQTTEIEWVGAAGNDIAVTTLPRGAGAVGDTVYISGKANCPVGVYNYNVVAKKDGVTYSSVPGKFTVSSKIDFVRSGGDTVQNCDLGEAITPIKFRAFVIDQSQVSLTWAGGNAPASVTTRFETTADGNYYYIEGTPTGQGTFKYTVSVNGVAFTGQLSIIQRDYANSILYLCKNVTKYGDRTANGSSGYDPIYDYLLITKGYNVIARKANPYAVQDAASYSKYQKMIVISEDVNGTDVEAIELARGVANLPVLNMKGFTYNTSRLGWGFPDNGSRSNKSITVREPSHPIFSNSSAPIAVLNNDNYIGKGLMPIEITKQNSVCLALAPTQSKTEYAGDGEEQTIIHEVPASDRNGQKYIAFPISREGSAHLSAAGKSLIDRIITYLTTNQTSPVVIPERRILSFIINGQAGIIDENDKTIRFTMDFGTDVSAVVPEVTLLNPQKTWWEANPAKSTVLADGSIQMNLSNSNTVGVWVDVRDYINVTRYMVYVQIPTGLEEIYVDGEWYDIYDYLGRKVASTNESLNTIELPHGMYIIRTARGSMKIFR